jgi:hypothetical protein
MKGHMTCGDLHDGDIFLLVVVLVRDVATHRRHGVKSIVGGFEGHVRAGGVACPCKDEMRSWGYIVGRSSGLLGRLSSLAGVGGSGKPLES